MKINTSHLLRTLTRPLCGGVTALWFVVGAASADIVDEAKFLGKRVEDFPTATYDYFRDMDRVPRIVLDTNNVPLPELDANGNTRLETIALNLDEIRGRNTWMMWCAGNEVFWDWLANHSYGFMDLLKLCDFPPTDRFGGKRFAPAGLFIEPGTKPASGPDEFGLYLRQPENLAAPRPNPDIYGRSSGIVGLRLFLNPKFNTNDSRYDEKAVTHWDAVKYRRDQKYFNDPKLARPYRVGMACAFCHASAHPLNPPANVEAPQWENLSTTIGAQYWRMRAVVGNLLEPDNFIYHLLDSQPPGTIDTSLIATDSINNPNTMNAIWDLPARLDRSGIFAHRPPGFAENYLARYGTNLSEKLSADSAKMPVLLQGRPDSYANPRPVPRVLLEGADSVGAWGALARVFLNIGTFSERWITLHNPIIGFRPQQVFHISDCEKNSVYWQVNTQRVEYLAKFFLKATAPMRLRDAPGGRNYLNGKEVPWAKGLERGRKIFAERCIVCHSSKQPKGVFEELVRNSPTNNPIALLSNANYKAWALAEVERQDFWENNFLSTDHRVPVTIIKTEAGRAMGSNGMTNHIWQDFSSDTYKELPLVGKTTYWDPFKKAEVEWTLPGGGRGYLRPPSLIGLWATAPYLHNNTVGMFNNDPSVKGRMAAFNDGIRRLLTLGKTEAEAAAARWSDFEPSLDGTGPINAADKARLKEDHGLIWRTSVETRLHIPGSGVQGLLLGVLPGGTALAYLVKNPWIVPPFLLLLALPILLKPRIGPWRRKLGYAIILLAVIAGFVTTFIAGKGRDLNIGPIPARTPVSLLSNVDPDVLKDHPESIESVKRVLDKLKELKQDKTDAKCKEVLNVIGGELLQISTSPDLVMDRGHYFTTGLEKEDLEELINLLQTF